MILRHVKTKEEFKELYENNLSFFEPDSRQVSYPIQELIHPAFLYGYYVESNEGVSGCAILFKTVHKFESHPVVFFGGLKLANAESGLFLLEQMKEHARQFLEGSYLLGPVNVNTWNRYRVAISNHDACFAGDVCNPEFYSDVLFESGFKITHLYRSNLQERLLPNPEFLYKEKWKVVFPGKDAILNSLPELYKISIKSFRNSAFFTEISEAEFTKRYQYALSVLDSSLIPLAYDENGSICGYIFAHPEPDANTIVVRTLAGKTERKYAGIGRMLSVELNRKAKEKGYSRMIHAFMEVDNKSGVLSGHFKSKLLKEYAIFGYLL